MIELAVTEAQRKFTKLLSKTVLIVDKKSHKKKAVLLPYEEYNKLIAKKATKEDFSKGVFSKFEGVLKKDFKTDDERYSEIVKWKSFLIQISF